MANETKRFDTASKNDLTELVFVLDCSGSMAGLVEDTIGGFNSMIEKQKSEPGRAFVSTVLFDGESRVLHDRLPLEQVPPMTRRDYLPGGCTALLDALGGAIRHIGNIHKYARPEDVPAHTLFVITTDGLENASRRYSGGQVRQMVQRQKDRYGWEFLFLGANIDAVETARQYGIGADRAATYRSDSSGTRLNYDVLSDAIGRVRAGTPMTADWKAPIEADMRQRAETARRDGDAAARPGRKTGRP